MKKLLLSMAAGLLCAGSALADTTVTFADLELGTNPTEFTAGTDFKFVADQNGGTTKPAYNANNKDLRLYAKNTLTVTSGADITSMVFNISKQGKKRLTDITASNGNVTISNPAEGDWTVTWTGNAAEVTFTVGEKATYGTDGESKAGQFCFTSMNIVGGGELGGITPPEPAEPNYFKATAVESGQSYVFVAGGMYNMLFEKNYGYMSSTNLPPAQQPPLLQATLPMPLNSLPYRVATPSRPHREKCLVPKPDTRHSTPPTTARTTAYGL